MHVTELPGCILDNIFMYLTYKETIDVATICKAFYEAAGRHISDLEAASRKMHINELPKCILDNIFSYLTHKETMDASTICREFCKAAERKISIEYLKYLWILQLNEVAEVEKKLDLIKLS